MLKRTEKPWILAGEIVTCAACKMEIAEVVRDLYFQEPCQADMFSSLIEDYKIQDGMQPECPGCRSHWWTGRQIHLRGGWV
jgi:hypothetical protein